MITALNYKNFAAIITIIFLNICLLGCGGGSASNTASNVAAIATVTKCSSEHDEWLKSGSNDENNEDDNDDDDAPYGDGCTSFTVSTSAGQHGSISPGYAVVNKGDTVSFTVTPDTGYKIDSVTGCDGTLSTDVNNVYTYTTGEIYADCTVAASFITDNSGGGPTIFTVSTSASEHGTISPVSADVNEGDTASFTVTPDTGYKIDSVSGCAGTLSSDVNNVYTYTTGQIYADCTVAATFISDNTGGGSSQFTVSTSAGQNGAISPASAVVNEGETASFTITANTGYKIDSVSGCGGALSFDNNIYTYTTSQIYADCTVAATFISDNTGGGPTQFTVSTSAGAHGTISPLSVVVNENDMASFTVTPDTGYKIDSVGGCGGTLSSDTTYTTGPISADCTVMATFIIDNSGGGPVTYSVSATAGTHGSISPNNAIVNEGDKITFTVTPDAGYLIDSVSGCGGTLSGSLFTTAPITTDCTVTASFIIDNSGSGTCTPPATNGTPWAYPCEISVAKAYNTVFLTGTNGGVPYDETSKEGLAALLADHTASEQQTNWTGWHSATTVQDPLTDVKNVVVLVADTPNTPTFGIKVGTTYIPIYTAGPWTPPSRGWINNPMGTPELDPSSGVLLKDWSYGVVSIPDLLKSKGLPEDSIFTFYIQHSSGSPINMDSSNTHRIDGNGTFNPGFLLAYENGIDGDGDFNEPIIYVNAPRSAPGGCFGHAPTILGTQRGDFIKGTRGNDVIMTFGGADTILAYGGDDIICPGDDNDAVFASAGNDIIIDDDGANALDGGAGADTIYAGDTNGKRNVVNGGAGDDHIYVYGGNNVVSGGFGDDVIYGGGGKDLLLGFAGNDIIHGDGGNDRIFGFSGNDQLYGDDGNDFIYGMQGTDYIDGGAGINTCEAPNPNSPHPDTVINCQ